MIRVAGLVGLAAACGACAPAEHFPADEPSRLEAVGAYAEAVLASRPTPGLAIGVVKRGALIYERAFGVGDAGTGEPLAPDARFHVASISKTFTAVAVMQQVEAGAIELDARLSRYLPEFAPSDPRAARITIGHLLTHTSGLPSEVSGDAWYEDASRGEAALAAYASAAAALKLEREPGAAWSYSNLGYNLLGLAVARVSGAPFASYQRDRILRPLGMTTSTFEALAADTPDLARPHRGALQPVAGGAPPYAQASEPSSTLKSNLRELSQWARMWLARPGSGPRLLERTTIEAMWAPVIAVAPDTEMALGWFVREHRGRRMLVHPGRDPGYAGALALLPDDDLAVIVLSNHDGQSATEMLELVEGVLDAGLGRTPRLPQRSLAQLLAAVAASDGADAAIAEYRRWRASGDTGLHATASDLITAGHERYQRADYEGALKLYALNAAEEPDYFHSHMAMASAYLKLGQVEQALAAYEEGLRRDPESWGCPKECYEDPEIEALRRR